MNENHYFRLSVSLLLTLYACAATAQETLLKKTIDQIGGYQNFSYRCTYKQKEAFGDTLIINRQFKLAKAPVDVSIPYLFTHQYHIVGAAAPTVEIYNGNNLFELNTTDSTYTTRGAAASYQQTLPAELNWLNNFYSKHPLKLSKLNDTLYHAANCHQLRVTTKDTVINGVRQFVYIYLFINKASGLPAGKLTRARTSNFGKEVTDYYTEETFSDYRFDQQFDTKLFNLPKGFRSPSVNQAVPPSLLTAGSQAPDFTLFDSEGGKVSLSTLKGKIVLLDFFFVGCVPCLQSLAPLDSLHRQYENKNLVILSISNRDSRKAVAEFKKVQKVANPVCPDGKNVADLYHVSGFPIFYLIDQQGKIAAVVDSYTKDLTSQLSVRIDGLIKKPGN